MARGGKREGTGRPKGTTKEPTVIFLEEFLLMKKFILKNV